MDPALIRPGRVDLKQLIGYATEHQLQQMFMRFYPELGAKMAAEFANKVTETKRPVSVAAVQGFFMIHKNNGHDVVKNINKLWS